MIKTCYLFCFVCFTFNCFAQINDSFYGVLLTKISSDNAHIDTSQMLNIRNITGNCLSVYTVRGSLVSEATTYQLTATKNGLFLYSKPLLSNQLTEDSLCISFQDKAHTVIINGTDLYVLFATYYARFKKEVKVKHSIMALLNLLSDAIGDYPISDALPLLYYTPALAPQIYQASIVTQRSQADMKDKWTCHYYYNKYHQLDSVSAISPEEIRYIKKIRYSGSNVRLITTYLNIESRQTTNRVITYNKENPSLLKSKEHVYETGKDRETISSVSLTWHDLGMLQKMEPSTTDVLELLKPKK